MNSNLCFNAKFHYHFLVKNLERNIYVVNIYMYLAFGGHLENGGHLEYFHVTPYLNVFSRSTSISMRNAMFVTSNSYLVCTILLGYVVYIHFIIKLWGRAN